MATIGVCVFCAATSVAALFAFMGLFILAPIGELILGIVVFLILGFIATVMHGNGDDLMKGAALFLALLGGIFGGGGTIYIVLFKD